MALVLTSGVCAALLAALLRGSVPTMGHFSTMGGARLLSIEPPCPEWEAPPPLPALPMPPQCRWSWMTFRCSPSFDCELRVRWRPLPHPTCRMRPD